MVTKMYYRDAGSRTIYYLFTKLLVAADPSTPGCTTLYLVGTLRLPPNPNFLRYSTEGRYQVVKLPSSPKKEHRSDQLSTFD